MFARKLLCVAVGSALGALALPVLAAPAVDNRAAEVVGSGAATDPLIAVEASRGAIIRRLVAEHAATLAEAGVDSATFRNALNALRADQLLAASLVSSVAEITAIVGEAPVNGSALQRFIALSPREPISMTDVPLAEAYLVRDGDALSIVKAVELQLGQPGVQLVGDFAPATRDAGPKDGTGTGANSWIGYVFGGNQATGPGSAVAAGTSNLASGQGSFVGAGTANQANGISSLVIGGFDNRAVAIDSLVGAGAGNRAIGARSIVVGGGYNSASGQFSFVGGGGRDGTASTPAGTDTKDNVASGNFAVVVGGQGSRATGNSSFVGGGGNAGSVLPNIASASGAVVVGGFDNLASGTQSFIGGGYHNRASALNASVLGGFSNTASGTGSVALGQMATASDDHSFVYSDGGNYASSGTNTFNVRSSGGLFIDDTTSIRMGSTTRQNITMWGNPALTTGSYGMGVQGSNAYFRVDVGTPNDDGFRFFRGGTHSNTAGDAGTGGTLVATLTRAGSLVLPNSNDQHIRLRSVGQGLGGQPFTTYLRTNESIAFFLGGVHADNALDPGAGGGILATVQLGAGSSTVTGNVRALGFTATSDRAQKSAFLPVDPRTILAKVAALPISTWTYNVERDSGVRHIGPVAQDFAAAFNVGYDDKTISTIDASGVALTAIKGLSQAMAEKDDEIAMLKRELAAIKRKLGL
jgi:hypothetical protein